MSFSKKRNFGQDIFCELKTNWKLFLHKKNFGKKYFFYKTKFGKKNVFTKNNLGNIILLVFMRGTND
jgi:hypothetical protein